jgi:mannose-6-phosphate isomerase
MTDALAPLLLEPRLLPKPWGGRRLAAWGKALPAGEAIGESWELFDDAQGSVRCTAGPAQGRSLAELRGAWGEGLLGPGASAGAFPLLVKLLDAREDLSVQVHPDDAVARALHGAGAVGKSELWVVLAAEPGARVLNGFKPGTDAAAFEAALAAGAVEGLLNSLSVAPGDVIEIPAGRVHAVGAGCLLAEIQQNSDLTYRVWDWGRTAAGRPLHLAEARRALRFGDLGCGDGRLRPVETREAWGLRERLLQGPHFSVERLRPEAPLELAPAGRPRVLLALRGDLRLVWGPEAGMMVPSGATALLPAALGARLESPGGVVLCVQPA